jgi:spore cortex formation protein SpoVR/YcgB (stage V sporulation)
MNTLSRAVLLVAPVIDTLQAQLAAEFPLFRLYEQDDPIAFLREQGRTLPPWSRGVMSVCKTVCWSCCRTWGW